MKVAKLRLKGESGEEPRDILVPPGHVTAIYLKGEHVTLLLINGKQATLVYKGESGLSLVAEELGWEV